MTFLHLNQAKNWTMNTMLSEGTCLMKKEEEEASTAAFCLLPAGWNLCRKEASLGPRLSSA